MQDLQDLCMTECKILQVLQEKYLQNLNISCKMILACKLAMDLIHYSFAPLILFSVPYTLDFLPYYLSIANGAGGVGIFELLVFQCFI